MDKPGHSSPQRESTEHLLVRLRQEHAMLEADLEAYNQRLYLGAREQMERKRLQKLKLVKKDLIQRLERLS
jgi:hypothetical protein